MLATTKSSAAIATAALLTAGLTPVMAAPEIGTHAVAALSTEITLAGNAVVDGLADAAAAFDAPAAEAFDIPGAADPFDVAGAAQAFDIAGLINAEFAAAQGFFNSLVSLPVTLFNDVERLFTSLVDLNFGEAFSAMFSIPQDIVNYVIGLPGMVVNTVYEMAVVIPGQFLFNFG